MRREGSVIEGETVSLKRRSKTSCERGETICALADSDPNHTRRGERRESPNSSEHDREGTLSGRGLVSGRDSLGK
jgi:hypothetical protein